VDYGGSTDERCQIAGPDRISGMIQTLWFKKITILLGRKLSASEI
jgi:hypothetical protein